MNLNEQGGLAPHCPIEDGEIQEQTVPLGLDEVASGDGEVGFDPLAGAGVTKKGYGGSILIVTVVLIAVAGLFSMRKLAEVTRGIGINEEIEAKIEKFIEAKFASNRPIGTTPIPGTGQGSDRTVLAVLETPYSEIQVPLRDVQRDPFVITDRPVTTIEPAEVDPLELSAQQQRRWQELRETRRSELIQIGESLELKAIMGGSNPLAIIEGQTLTVGATIEDSSEGVTFTLTKIDRGFVELETEAPEFDVNVMVKLYLKRDH